MVVDIGLSCPSCRVQLTLPSAYLGQVVTGPCPVCGTTLVFCHGRIENAPVVETGSGEAGDSDRLALPRTKFSRTGTIGVHYLDELAFGDGGESNWGVKEGVVGAEEADGVVPGPTNRVSRLSVWAAVVGVLVMGWAGWYWTRPLPPLPIPRPPAPTVSTGARAVVPGWGEGAQAAWKAFLEAKSVEEKLPHVLDAVRVAPVMQAYYAQRPGLDVSLVGRAFSPMPGTPEDRQRGILVLGSAPKAAGERPMLVFLRTAPPGRNEAEQGPPKAPFLIDWETFVQERDGLVEDFLNDTTAPKRTFRLAVERAHVFEGGGLGAGATEREAMGFRLRTPSGVSMGRVAALFPDSPIHARLASQLRWGMTAYATLQLAWEVASDETPQLRVADFVCWHFPGLGGKPEFEADLSPLPLKERPSSP